MPIIKTFILPLVLLCAFTSAAQAAPYSYATHQLQLTDLGAGVKPSAINNVGQVVGQGANSQAFLWSAGTTTPLGTVGGTQSYANDINDNGVVVGWSHDAAQRMEAFKWTSGTGMLNIDAVGNTAFSAAEAINNYGEIIGWRTNGTAWKTTYWDVVNPNGTVLFAAQGDHKGLGINDDGHVVGITVQSGIADDGYYWDGTSGGTNFSSGLGINYYPYAGINQGNVTAGITANELSYLTVGVNFGAISVGKISPSDPFSIANGLNNLGLIVGESGDKGVLYDVPNQNRFDLNLFPRQTSGFGQVLRLNDINNDGKFVGVALVNGVEHGFVGQLVPVPEPSSLLLLSIGLVWIIARRRRS